MEKIKNCILLGLLTLNFVSCGNMEDLTNEETGEYVTVKSGIPSDTQGGYCTNETTEDFLKIISSCKDGQISKISEFETCEKNIINFKENIELGELNCYVRDPRRENSVYHVKKSKINDLIESSREFRRENLNFKSGTCGRLVQLDISDFYLKYVDFEKETYAEDFLKESRIFFKKYIDINCKNNEGKLYNEEFFNRINADIQFNYTVKK